MIYLKNFKSNRFLEMIEKMYPDTVQSIIRDKNDPWLSLCWPNFFIPIFIENY